MDSHKSHNLAVPAAIAPSRSRTTKAEEDSTNYSTTSADLGHQQHEAGDKMLDFFEVFGEDDFAVAFFFWTLVTILAVIGAILFVSLSWLTAFVAVLAGFVIFRHVSLRRERGQLRTGRGWVTKSDPNSAVPDTSGLPAVYFLYVLGSGGHSAEMIETIKQKFCGQRNQHRRYIITSGDGSSLNMVKKLEATISDAYPDERAGTRDVFNIKRARAVHQPKCTAPFTSLLSAAHAINALTREPNLRPVRQYGYQFKYPHVIVTNGPATGFIVALVAYLLKIFYLVPQNRLKTVYIESWARTKTLSLTGKLFLHTGIADMFCVQHQPLARAIPGAEYVGQVTARLTPVG